MGDEVLQAQRLAQLGRANAAVAVLEAAGESGDSSAFAELAIWYLRGDLIGRDLVIARRFLREAVVLGHVDAALMEIALTANGGGGIPDWGRAMDLLHDAAEADPIAQRHRELLDQMDLNVDGAPQRPPEGETVDDRLPIVRYRSLLSEAECAHIAQVAVDILAPSTVFDPKTGRQVTNPIRTSDGAIIGPTREDLVIQAIHRRIASVTNTDVAQGEPLSVLRYSPGQQYRLHYDVLANTPNNRFRTVLIYLNGSYVGGETAFPDLAVTITPRAGDAIVFDSLSADGTVLHASRHAGLPVGRGQKWLATRWIRQQSFDPWAA